MEIYLKAFINFEWIDWAKLFPMAEFAYNNAKNASINYIPFELNCSYHIFIFYTEDINPHPKSNLADDLVIKLRELMAKSGNYF